MHNISDELDKITTKIFKKRGFYQDKILTYWKLIIGEELFSKTIPSKVYVKKLKDKHEGKLEIYVRDNNSAIEIQHIKEYIIEKIAIYFGYKAINNIVVIIKAEFFEKKEHSKNSMIEYAISEDEENQLKHKISYIEDENLKKSLYNLGKLIMINYRKSYNACKF